MKSNVQISLTIYYLGTNKVIGVMFPTKWLSYGKTVMKPRIYSLMCPLHFSRNLHAEWRSFLTRTSLFEDDLHLRKSCYLIERIMGMKMSCIFFTLLTVRCSLSTLLFLSLSESQWKLDRQRWIPGLTYRNGDCFSSEMWTT